MTQIFEPIASSLKYKLYRWALRLAVFTIAYNIAEGLVSVFLGLEDETLSLFGFGLDSFVEVISGIGIWHMIRRLQNAEDQNPDYFERQALKITGTAFYLLFLGVGLTACMNLIQGRHPQTTFWGVVISLVSIATMGALIYGKTKVGKKLHSPAILADAACTKACMYLSFVLLFSSAAYELTGVGRIDAAGALVIAWLAFKEGKEAFGKARGMACACGGDCASTLKNKPT